MIRIKSDKIITNGKLFSGYLYIEGDKIVELSTTQKTADTVYDFSGLYVSAGFIDMHTHGAGGFAFLTESANAVVLASNYHLLHGTTTLLPTVSATSYEKMKGALLAIKQAKQSANLKNHILGAHLEGPYLSLNQSGAQSSSYITAPVKEDYVQLINEYKGYITRWTYAPERDENGEFASYLTKNGILPSIGHSDAVYKDVVLAVKNGCNLVTHLYSCTSTVTRKQGFRSLGVIESAFLLDELYVEIIADGKHLPPELINMIIKIKGENKVALITDSLAIAGTDIKEGEMSGVEFIVEDGVCKLKDRTAFAGSVATANKLIATLVKECEIPIEKAVKMLTVVPAEILKINKGDIAPKKDADVIVFNENIEVKDIFVMGQKIQ